MQYLAIREILWAGNSLDMNPTRELLIVAIQEVLREFQQEYFRALANSEPKRIAMVRDADGQWGRKWGTQERCSQIAWTFN